MNKHYFPLIERKYILKIIILKYTYVTRKKKRKGVAITVLI